MGAELTTLLIVLGGLGLFVVVSRLIMSKRGAIRNKARLWKPRRKNEFRPWDQEAQLLRLCHGNRELMERLIAHELERSPQLSRAGAALAAATRLRHDKK
jgi:hypothetical protein